MDKKQLRRFKADQIAQFKTIIDQIPDLKSESGELSFEEHESSARLNAITEAHMNPESLVASIKVQDGLISSIFKKNFHTPLKNNLRNKVTYSLIKNRRKQSKSNFILTTTYHCYDVSAIKKFLPVLDIGRVGFDSDFSVLITTANYEDPLVIKYNWHEQEITLRFDVDKWRGNFVDGQFVGNPI